MRKEDILNAASIPASSPSYPKGPYRFINREFFIITYLTDVNAIREILPEPLEPDGSGTVMFEFIRMPDGSGFGDFTECGLVIPAKFNGCLVNYNAQLYLDCFPPIAAGREIWGFPKKYAKPNLKVEHDTLTGTLSYADQLVALGTMGYKFENAIKSDEDAQNVLRRLSKTQVNLKLIPSVTGEQHDIAQLVEYTLDDITVKGMWLGPARLHLVPHVNAPVADLPVKKIVNGCHLIADLTLSYGKVLYDYLR